MNITYLKKFNNYYNRRIKRFNSLSEYINNFDSVSFVQQFNPNDGVNTTRIINWVEEWTPDYLIVSNTKGTIVSRWFVIEASRTRNGQYEIQLHRDLLADYYDLILDAPIYIQKGNLAAENDLIFNKENILLNQIKKEEILLKDSTKTAWIVGYINDNAIIPPSGSDYVEIKSNISENEEYLDISSIGLNFEDPNEPERGATILASDKIYFNAGITTSFDSNGLAISGRLTAPLNINTDSWENGFYKMQYEAAILGSVFISRKTGIFPNFSKEASIWAENCKSDNNILIPAYLTHLRGINRQVISSLEYSNIKNYEGKIVYNSYTNKYYRFSLGTILKQGFQDKIYSNQSYDQQLYNALYVIANRIAPEIGAGVVAPYQDGGFTLGMDCENITVSLVEVSAPEEIVVRLKPSHNRLIDAPYSMFAMPFSLENMALANEMSKSFTKENLYDIQILPYCPAINNVDIDIDNNLTPTGSIDIDYSLITTGGEEPQNVSFILWAKESSNSFTIRTSIEINYSDAIELKLSNECDTYRIVSPNYNGAFEFSVAKNDGVDFFTVSYTYKPFTPYILVSPNFKRMYGADFSDARGLICNGDFSIATLTSAWETFEVNNKNYQNIFNVDIKTNDINYRLNTISQGISSGMNAISTGIAVGAMGGGAAGGIAAAAGSTVAGMADLTLGYSIYQNNRQSKIDIFDLNLQNVKARPNTLNKISAYNINNKYFPFIEKYSCSDTEREALRRKLKYEGMTVGIISTISEFADNSIELNYIKGQLILLENISDDYHIVDAIGVELEKGVYI